MRNKNEYIDQLFKRVHFIVGRLWSSHGDHGKETYAKLTLLCLDSIASNINEEFLDKNKKDFLKIKADIKKLKEVYE